MHENDQDYEVAEPGATSAEDSDAMRSRAGRFWRSQPDRVSAADEPDADDETVVHHETGLDDKAALDNETGLNDEPGLDDDFAETRRADETVPADQTVPADSAVPADEIGPDDDVVVVAEVIETESAIPAGERAREPFAMPAAPGTTAAGPDETAGNGMSAPTAVASQPLADETARPAVAGDTPATATAQSFGSQEWREIQATFVDDPHGAVQMAASAADNALDALVAGLRERQSSLTTAGPQDTEQLRAALQEYRKFCQAVSEIGRQLPEPVTARS